MRFWDFSFFLPNSSLFKDLCRGKFLSFHRNLTKITHYLPQPFSFRPTIFCCNQNDSFWDLWIFLFLPKFVIFEKKISFNFLHFRIVLQDHCVKISKLPDLSPCHNRVHRHTHKQTYGHFGFSVKADDLMLGFWWNLVKRCGLWLERYSPNLVKIGQ